MQNYMNTDLDVTVHTDELHDIVSAPPIWLIRWGISLFLLLLCLFAALSAVITYPDFIEIPLTINSLDQPKVVRSGLSGRITELIVPDNSVVKKGQVLAYIQHVSTEAYSGHFPDSRKEPLIAPCAGKLNYIGLLKQGLPIAENHDVFIISETDEHFFGELHIPQNEVSKTKVGQDVLIWLDNISHEEGEALRGKIKYINRMPYLNSVFFAEVDISDPYKTSQDSTTSLRTGMTVKAEVITLNTSLLQRIINSVNRW